MPARLSSVLGRIEWRHCMAEITVFGFPHSSFVHIAQLVLMHKEAPYTFHDLEPDIRYGLSQAPRAASVRPSADLGARRFRALRDERDRRLSRGAVPDAFAAARYGTRPGADESVDQCGKFLLLPIHDLSRRTRAERVPAARHPVRREGRGARPAQDRGRAAGAGKAAVARSGVPARRRVDACRLLPAAEHLFVRAPSRRPDDVRGLPGGASLGRTDGDVAGCAAAPRSDRGSAADLACQEVARNAPAEILSSCEKTGAADSPSEGAPPSSAPSGTATRPLPAICHARPAMQENEQG